MNSLGYILDLILISIALRESVNLHKEDEWLVRPDSYHPPLAIDVRLKYSLPVQSSRHDVDWVWDFEKANFFALYDSFCCLCWEELYGISDPQKAVDHFYHVLNSSLLEFVPKKSSAIAQPRYVYPEWYSPRTKRHIRKKAHYHRLYKSTGNPSSRMNFMEWRARVKLNIKDDFKQYKCRMENDLRRDPTTFWGYVASKRTPMRMTKQLLHKGKEVSDDKVANCFAEYFKSVYSSLPPLLDVQDAVKWGGNDSERIHISSITRGDIEHAIKLLKPKRSVGPDGIPPFVVKDCGAVLLEPLLYVFQLCFKNAFYPCCWKVTRVIPVPKGSSKEVCDHRPIAILSVFGKLFESIIQSRLSRQVESQMTDAQHGFRPKRSTTSNLLSWSYTVNAVDAGSQVDATYFDFRKAFDTVDNDVLLRKLSLAGFTPHLLKFFAEYLSDRRQYVQYKGFRSDPYNTYSGVSQGSNLGPLLFSLMINDLPGTVKSARCLLFADDLKLFMKIENVEDTYSLQADIDSVLLWSRTNKLLFNDKKCSVITFTRTKYPVVTNYSLGDEALPRVTLVKDLGVWMSADMSFSTHVIKICSESFRTLGFVTRQARHLDSIPAIKMLYNAFVRSKLESNSIIWNPYQIKYTMMVEKIQRKFLRWLYQKQYGFYVGYPNLFPSDFILGMTGYNTLEVRRIVSLMMYVARITRGQLTNPTVLEEIGLLVPDISGYLRTRRRGLYAVPFCRTELRASAPIMRALKVLNNLQINQDWDIFEGEIHRTALDFVSADVSRCRL